LWLHSKKGNEQEELPFELLLRLTTDPLVVWSGRDVIGFNDAAMSAFSFKPQESYPSQATVLLAPVFDQIKQKHNLAMAQSGELEVNGEIQLQDLNNENILVRYTAQRIEKNGVYTAAILKPKTVLPTEDERFIEVRSRFETIFENSPVAHFVVSRRGTIREVNRAACRLLGYKREDLLKRNITTFQPHAGEESEHSQRILQTILDGDVLHGVEAPLVNASSERVWVNITSSPIETRGRVSEISIMAADITRRREAEMREEEEANRANLYLEVMTHDLSNINQSLVFSLGLIQEKMDLPSDIESLLRDTNWNLRRSARMISNMRALITLRETPPEKRPIDPYEML
jgi:PAS domain S-box-containing protein